MASTHSLGTPIARAMARFCDTALMCSPRRVRVITMNRAAKTSIVKRTMDSRLTVIASASLIWSVPLIQAGVSTDRLFAEKIDRTSCCNTRLTPNVARRVSSGRP